MAKKSNKKTADSIEAAIKNLKKRCEDNEIVISPKSKDFEYILAEEAIKQDVNPGQLYLILFGNNIRK